MLLRVFGIWPCYTGTGLAVPAEVAVADIVNLIGRYSVTAGESDVAVLFYATFKILSGAYGDFYLALPKDSVSEYAAQHVAHRTVLAIAVHVQSIRYDANLLLIPASLA